MRTVLITLIGPEHTTDLVVDADTPAADLLPNLLSAVAAEPGADPRGWTLAVTGKQALIPEQTLDEAGVLDGAVLVLRRNAPAPPRASAPPAGATTAPGSPLARTRQALADGPRRRVLGAAVPEAALGADARLATLERVVTEAPLARCVTIAVLSPKGGVGKTTLSILLGEALSALRAEHVLALDADSDYGSLGRVSQITPHGPQDRRDDGIFPALAGGAVTFAELNRTLWALPGGLRIVPSPREPTAMARTDRATYTRVIGNLQRLTGVLVIDCGTGLGQPGVQSAILASDQLVLVTDASGATASLAAEAFGLLERAGRPITVAANRLVRGRTDDDLARLDASFPRASGLVGIPQQPEAERALSGDLQLAAAPRPLRLGVLELAAALAADWGRLAGPRTIADSA